jgi:hypothetical protein
MSFTLLGATSFVSGNVSSANNALFYNTNTPTTDGNSGNDWTARYQLETSGWTGVSGNEFSYGFLVRKGSNSGNPQITNMRLYRNGTLENENTSLISVTSTVIQFVAGTLPRGRLNFSTDAASWRPTDTFEIEVVTVGAGGSPTAKNSVELFGLVMILEAFEGNSGSKVGRDFNSDSSPYSWDSVGGMVPSQTDASTGFGGNWAFDPNTNVANAAGFGLVETWCEANFNNGTSIAYSLRAPDMRIGVTPASASLIFLATLPSNNTFSLFHAAGGSLSSNNTFEIYIDDVRVLNVSPPSTTAYGRGDWRPYDSPVLTGSVQHKIELRFNAASSGSFSNGHIDQVQFPVGTTFAVGLVTPINLGATNILANSVRFTWEQG